MPSNRQIQQYEAEQTIAGWNAMSALIAHVQNGGIPARIPPTIMCRAGEEQYGTLPVDSHVYCGADVEYSSSMFAAGGLFFTAATLAASAAVNANKRRKAEAESRPQWRPWGRFPAIITNQRLMLMTEQWSTYAYSALIMIEPNPMNYSLSLHFEGAYPIMIRGPWVPWATVAICATLFGKPWPPGYNPPPPVQVPSQPQPSQIPEQHQPQPQQRQLPGSP
jgi:hypothetical protein